jgi:hypothetical protein
MRHIVGPRGGGLHNSDKVRRMRGWKLGSCNPSKRSASSNRSTTIIVPFPMYLAEAFEQQGDV